MYLGKTKKYQFYSAEIDHCPKAKLQRIVEACKAIEESVWNPTSDFYEYLKKQSAVVYAKYNNQVVGFALFDLYIDGKSLVVSGSECMLLKEHQGQGLPTIMSSILTSHIQRDNKQRKLKRPYSSMTFISLTVHFKLMAAFRYYSFFSDSNTFKPDEQLLSTAGHYLKKENLELIEPGNLFFARSAFPSAVKLKPNIQPPNFVPENFQPERGDAFLFVARISKFWVLGLVAKYIRFRYGFRFSQRVIPIRRISHEQIIYSRGENS